jgi:alpha-galactosidase
LEEQGVIFAWFRKRKKEQKEDEVGQRSWDFIAGSELITADALISTGLAELGYVYLNIDDC